MKKLLLIFFIFFTNVAIAQEKDIYDKPNPPTAVNDFANLLEPFQREALEQKLRDYNDSTSSAIVIITVPTLKGYDVSELALKYLRGWGVGMKDRDNGVVILVAKAEHKINIQTGYGMEGVLPDITAKHIIDERMTPSFKQDDYFRGFDQAIDAIILAARGEYKADKKNSPSPRIPFKTIFIIIVIIIILISRGGGGGGRYMSRRGSRGLGGLPWFILGNMMGSGSRGSGWGGSSGGFGGGGGGGFGGFGGGSGGGGGASGGW